MVSFTTILTIASAASAVSVPSAAFDSLDVVSPSSYAMSPVVSLKERGLFDGIANWWPFNHGGDNGKACDLISFEKMLGHLADMVRQILSISKDVVTLADTLQGVVNGVQIVLTAISVNCLGRDLQIMVASIVGGITNIKRMCGTCKWE